MSLISNTFWIVFVLSAIVFILVCAFMLAAALRSRRADHASEPRQVYGNQPLEIGWTLIPTAVLTVAFIVTVYAIHDINTPAKSANPLNINAIGHQWWWEFQYPSLGVETANEVHVPQGTQIHFHVESGDVIHSFWTPQLQRQIDANPGQDNPVFVKMTRTGTYGGMCYEYCGEDHAWMKYELIVDSPAGFKAWVRQQTRTAVTPATAMARRGQYVFLHQTCVSCHAISGTAAGGAVAPNLTHVGSRWAIAAGAAPDTIAGLEGWIYNPSDYKPGAMMPSYRTLPKQDIQALATYLYSLK